MHVAVLGGGNGSFAAAADLSEQGHRVSWWRRDQAATRKLLGNPELTMTDARGSRRIPIAAPNLDLARTIADAELIVAPLPAFAQQPIARSVAPFLRDGQIILLPPGTFGSLIFAAELQRLDRRIDIAFAESATLPYLTRKHSDQEIAITTRATRLPTGVFPACKTDWAMTTLKQAYPAIEPLDDALSGALMNAGPIIHPPLIIMNAGPIEHFEHWDIHSEGTQSSIRQVTDRLDAERIAIRENLGYLQPHFPLADHYSSEGDEWMYGNLAHDRLQKSGDWRESLDLKNHRYMTEDVLIGLGFMISVAEWSGHPCPIARSLLTLGQAICGLRPQAGARTLASLNLAHLSLPQMRKFLQLGYQ